MRCRKLWKARLLGLWRGWGRPILVVVLVLGSFRSAVADWNDVPTGSMRPTILEGDRILVNKLAYDLKVPFTSWRFAEWGGPERGDIVVCFSPADGRRLVKRVIGLPGDRLEMVENRLIVNGAACGYEPLSVASMEAVIGDAAGDFRWATEALGDAPHPIMITPGQRALRSFDSFTVPEGQYFVMGDNRDQSGDSRVFGFVPRRKIVGRAFGIALSVDPDHYYLPRWKRFFSGLR
ncbi:MAG: signal peptidase I [bacterium]|nr:signal peptidase I [bacterium]